MLYQSISKTSLLHDIPRAIHPGIDWPQVAGQVGWDEEKVCLLRVKCPGHTSSRRSSAMTVKGTAGWQRQVRDRLVPVGAGTEDLMKIDLCTIARVPVGCGTEHRLHYVNAA